MTLTSFIDAVSSRWCRRWQMSVGQTINRSHLGLDITQQEYTVLLYEATLTVWTRLQCTACLLLYTALTLLHLFVLSTVIVLNVFIVVIINCCLTLIYCTFQPMVALINHWLTYLLYTLHVHVHLDIYYVQYRHLYLMPVNLASTMPTLLHLASIRLPNTMPTLLDWTRITPGAVLVGRWHQRQRLQLHLEQCWLDADTSDNDKLTYRWIRTSELMVNDDNNLGENLLRVLLRWVIRLHFRLLTTTTDNLTTLTASTVATLLMTQTQTRHWLLPQ